jgi:hypothetical protein
VPPRGAPAGGGAKGGPKKNWKRRR